MESLYTKYRPQTFADVVGQTHVVTTLERAVIEGRTSHAYLFCGPRGTGKTTMARLLAKALMCEQGEGHLPDGTCDQCQMIAAGEHPDVYELDAASRTGVDNVRDEIISRVSFAPVRAPYKMYIIDEVHMLTVAAFNALLKTLEEPPSHVVFVLCTTDPQKIPETILSRVQRFDFHSISNTDIQARLAYICEREGFSYDEEALALVVRHARGGMRDAISELEQLSVSGGGSITVDVARDVLGEVSASMLERMSLSMAKRDVPSLFAQVESLVDTGRDLLQFTRALAGRLRDVYVVCAIGASSDTIQASDDDLPALSREAKAFGSVDRVARVLGLLSDASSEMRVAPNQRLVLEVALTKAARPQTELTLEALADRVASLERQVAALSAPSARRAADEPAGAQGEVVAEPRAPKPRAARTAARAAQEQKPAAAAPASAAAQAPAAAQREATPQPSARAASVPVAAPRYQEPAAQPATTVAAPAAQPQAQVAAPTQRQPQATTPAQRAPQAPQPQRQAAQAARSGAAESGSAQAPTAASASGGAGASGAVSDQGELQRRWRKVVDDLRAAHPQYGSLLMNSVIVSDDGGTVTVCLPTGSGFAVKMLGRTDVRGHVEPLLHQAFGMRALHVVEGDTAAIQAGSATAAPAAAAPAPQRQAAPTPTPQRQTAAASAPSPAPQRQAAPAPAPTQQATPTPASVSQRQTAPAPAPRSQTPAYPAPWDPIATDDDVVPYDDFDAAPYEEDLYYGGDFGGIAASTPSWDAPAPASAHAAPATRSHQPTRPAPQPAPAPQPSASPSSLSAAPVPNQAPAQQPQAVATPQPTPAPQAPTVPPVQPSSQPAVTAPAPTPQPVAPASKPVPTPQPTPQPVPTPQPAASAPQSTPASASPTSEQPAPAETPTEQPKAASSSTSRNSATGGVPASILNMLTDVFGSVTNYSVEPPEGETADGEDVDAAEAYDDAGESVESEYIDEPVDDADDDEDED